MATTAKEIRALPVTIRAAGEGEQRTIGGAILYGKETALMRDYWGDAWCEELAAGCFDDSLQARDVVALWSHDTAAVLGNTRNRTLRLESGETELGFDLDLPDTTAGRDAFESVKRGDVSGVSFGMVVVKDKWTTEKRDGELIYKRTVLAAELWELSPVAFPAYPANEVSCRSLEKFKEESEMGNETKTKEPKKEGKLMETIRQIEKELEDVRSDKAPKVPSVAIPATPVDKAKEQRAAFNHYLRTGEIRDNDSALTVGGGGAALAPDDFAKEIIDGLNDDVVLRGLARILPAISGKSAVYPRRTGGGGAAMVAEGAAITPQDLEFDQIKLVPQKAAALVEVSNELLQDSGVDLAGYLSQHFVDEIGELLESEYWNGVGTAPNLQGILTATNEDTTPAITRVETAATTGVGVDDILALWAALPAKYRRNAVFVCNSAMEAVLRKLKDGDGRYLMVPDLTAGLGSTLLGRPLVLAEEFPGTLEAGTDALMVGDFGRAVFIADKAGIDIQRNDAIGFNKDTTAFRAILRTDVALALPEALKVLAIKE